MVGAGAEHGACDGFGGTRPAGAHATRPALDIRLPTAPAALLPRLDALLDDHDPFAISDGADGEPAGTGSPGFARFLERRVYFFSAGARDAARRAIDRVLGPDGARTTSVDVSDDGWAARSHADLRAVQVGDLVVADLYRPQVGV